MKVIIPVPVLVRTLILYSNLIRVRQVVLDFILVLDKFEFRDALLFLVIYGTGATGTGMKQEVLGQKITFF